MADERFDLTYAGAITPGADPALVRERLGSIFKLSEQGIERLFTGKPVIVKRQADAATRAQYERIFAQAGAVLRVTPSDPAASSHVAAGQAAPVPASTASPADPLGAIDTSRLALAPPGGFIEEPPAVKMPDLDTSYLSLVPDPDWSLEDCEPPATAIPVPDISHLTLVEIEPVPDRADDD